MARRLPPGIFADFPKECRRKVGIARKKKQQCADCVLWFMGSRRCEGIDQHSMNQDRVTYVEGGDQALQGPAGDNRRLRLLGFRQRRLMRVRRRRDRLGRLEELKMSADGNCRDEISAVLPFPHGLRSVYT
jgi:hypothetical protein